MTPLQILIQFTLMVVKGSKNHTATKERKKVTVTC